MANPDTAPQQIPVEDGRRESLTPVLPLNDCLILASLSEDGGYMTRDIARKVHGEGRKFSAKIADDLKRLEGLGLTARLDDQKPICWRRTEKGSRLLRRAAARGVYPQIRRDNT